VLEATRGLLLVYGIGAITGPVLGGPLMDVFGPGTVPAYSAAVLGLLGLIGLARMMWRSPVPVAEQSEFVPMIRTTPMALEMLPQAEAQMTMDLPPAERP
jgi:predicted MFS family arabinose efflux permease